MSGFDVDVYFSSEKASEDFQRGRYSLAILDVLMDGMGGIELYKIISNIDNNIRVCFLTGYDINASNYPDLPENKNCSEASLFDTIVRNHQNTIK